MTRDVNKIVWLTRYRWTVKRDFDEAGAEHDLNMGAKSAQSKAKMTVAAWGNIGQSD